MDNDPNKLWQRRGLVDPLLDRQINSDLYCFRVIGELRYVLSALLEDLPHEELWEEFTKRAHLSYEDPHVENKKMALWLLMQSFDSVPRDPAMVKWMTDCLSTMDPANPGWLELKNSFNPDQLPDIDNLPGSISASVIFLMICHACDLQEQAQEAKMKRMIPELVAKGLNSPPIPPPTQEARLRHMQQLEKDLEYRKEVEYSLETILDIISKEPRIIKGLRDSMKMTQFIGFPQESKAIETYAVMREEIDALLQAVESGEIKPKKKKTVH